jgi:hypothetical protein
MQFRGVNPATGTDCAYLEKQDLSVASANPISGYEIARIYKIHPMPGGIWSAEACLRFF